VIASCGGQQFHEKMLITHRGLSGPAILQISSYWKKPQPILIDLAPGREVHSGVSRSKDAEKSERTTHGVAKVSASSPCRPLARSPPP
jgi:predicted flavoprotein YhiN